MWIILTITVVAILAYAYRGLVEATELLDRVREDSEEL